MIVDKALEERERIGKPIRVGMVGAGFMARGVAIQMVQVLKGMELVAVSNRNLSLARRAYSEAGVEDPQVTESLSELEVAIAAGHPAICEDAHLLCQAGNIDVILEMTGAIEFGCQIALECFAHGKHLVTMNAEMDATVGPALLARARAAGVVYSLSDGDQPGVTMNLYRFVQGIGMRPVLLGNIKGLHDPYRNPTTQEEYAKTWKQQAHMVTSFADGSKISIEQANVANATGMRVARRGMIGPAVEPGTPVQETTDLYPLEAMLEGPGIVDYIVGAHPAPGVFIYATNEHAVTQHYLNYYKLGEGPLYVFYHPYHLCHFETPFSVARAALFDDATLAPEFGLSVDVVATAKTDLQTGDTVDGIGWYMTYGLCENADVVARGRLLPIGLAEGCKLLRDVPKDQVLTLDDVEIPPARLVDQLRAECAGDHIVGDSQADGLDG